MSEHAGRTVGQVSVVYSFYNEAAVLRDLVERTRKTLAQEVETGRIGGYEMIFVNDASTDESEAILLEEAKKDPAVRIITMSRNFGIFECLMAGFSRASGDVVAYLDADLQDPPELIATLLEEYRRHPDADVVLPRGRNGWAKIP